MPRRIMLTLEDFIRLNGDVTKLNLDETTTSYYDGNKGKKVTHIRTSSKKSGGGSQLYEITFSDGVSHTYAGMWVQTMVELILAPQFTSQ